MRTTLNTIYSRINTNLGKITTDMAKINDQISSGMQMAKLADEPINLVSALRFRSSIVELDQYNENIQSGNTIITAAETALTQMKELSLRAKTLAIQATDPANTTANKESIAVEIKNMFEQAVSLANTQVNGKFIFGGFRTTGYTDIEPAPFVMDKGDGYWINSTTQDPLSAALTGGAIASASAATTTDLVNNDLLINGTDIGAVSLAVPAVAVDANGINMEGALNLRDRINAAVGPAVTATLTTLVSGAAAPGGGAAAGQTIDFTINNVQVAYTTALTATAQETAQETVDAINTVASKTGVTAVRGTGSNGGPNGAVVLKNTLAGDQSIITLTGLGSGPPDEETITGLKDSFSSGVTATNNTGQLSLTSSAPISITTSSLDDTILTRIGLGGGSKGNYDAAGDGQLVYGYLPLTADELKINGFAVPAATNDPVSQIYADSSAFAKARAINSLTTLTGVTAVVSPASVVAAGGVSGGTESTRLTGAVTNNNAIALGDLAINGTVIGGIGLGLGPINGINPDRASTAKDAINLESAATGVFASLTTLCPPAGPATAPGAQAITFTINGTSISLTTGGISPTTTASDIVAAINAKSGETGVEAVVGNGMNGGLNSDEIVLKNAIQGDESNIVVAGAPALSGLGNATYSIANPTNNTGEISLESASPFTLTSPTTVPPSDAVLTELGLSSATDTGTITYGATPTHLDVGDLQINGVDIFQIPTAILGKDADNSLLDAINAKTSLTGVKATRDINGNIQLTVEDGSNIHVETSTNGEAVTHLTNGSRDLVAFGSLQLRSDRKFILESVAPSVNSTEPGLAAIGLAGGETLSGEPDDTAGDGKIDVFSIHNRTGSVRYTGDRVNDLEIKIGKTNTMVIGDNGKTGVMDTSIFTTLKALEDYLRGDNFTTITGIHAATDHAALLNSKTTGLEPESQLPTEDLFSTGSFTVSILDHDHSPPQSKDIIIGIDPTTDTLDSVTSRLDGLPHISASWTTDGHLKIESDDPARYTFALSNDSSNFLKATGVSSEFMQNEGILQSVADLDTLMENLTRQVSDFGSRANRIDIQSQIYSTMTIATKENLSEVQDTDMIKAVMDLKAKETAYQAALSSAAKTMQLSLVDYLK